MVQDASTNDIERLSTFASREKCRRNELVNIAKTVHPGTQTFSTSPKSPKQFDALVKDEENIRAYRKQQVAEVSNRLEELGVTHKG